jgi:ABC-type transport system substrate-binding protein
MEMEKKNLAIIILAIVLAASGIGNIVLAITGGFVQAEAEEKEVLKVGRTSNPVTFDPCDSWDSVSNDVLSQVVEQLIFFDYTDLTLYPQLCVDWVWDDLTHITFELRQNVYFHDGALFTAEDVKHTYDRLNYLGNSSGTLPATEVQAFAASIYKFGNGTPIIKEIIINSDYNCTMVLNAPFAPIEGLLAYTGSSIVSKSSSPADTLIDLSTDIVIGTGPFKMINYAPNSEVRFARWERYWRTGAYWDEVVYVYYSDATTHDQAMLALDIDYRGQCTPAVKAQMEADPNIHVEEIGVGTVYRYVTFNSERINMYERKAISHAYNYTFHLNDILEGTAMKANSLVPPGFPGYNASVVGGTYNVPKAREYMAMAHPEAAGWDVGTQTWGSDVFTPGADEDDWASANFLEDIGFRRHPASSVAAQMLVRFTEDMLLIGVEIVDQPMTWADYIQEAAADPSFIGVCYTGWGPDYFETFNMIDPLVNPASASNFAQIDIDEITVKLDEAAQETDTETRYELYEYLQYLVIDKYAVHMPTEFEFLYAVVANTLKGFPFNINEDLYWWPTYRGPNTWP